MEYIKIKIYKELEKWASSKNRKPVLLRGARQVGKSSSVRKLSEKFEYFLEINFEMEDDIRKFFETASNLNKKVN